TRAHRPRSGPLVPAPRCDRGAGSHRDARDVTSRASTSLDGDLEVVGVGIARRVLHLEVGPIGAGLRVHVLGVGLARVRAAVAEFPDVGEWRLATLDVRRELDGQWSLPL